MTDPPLWERQGFAREPDVGTAAGGAQVMRAFAAHPFFDRAGNRYGSHLLGNCFFVFREDARGGAIRAVDRGRLARIDAAMLEANLNAGLWNNTYAQVQVFGLPPGTAYRIGPVGHTIRTTERVKTTRGGAEATVPARMDPAGVAAARLLQVVLMPPVDLAHLPTIGAPMRVPGAWRYSGDRSALAQ